MLTRSSHWTLKSGVNDMPMHHQIKANTNGDISQIKRGEAWDGNREGTNILKFRTTVKITLGDPESITYVEAL